MEYFEISRSILLQVDASFYENVISRAYRRPRIIKNVFRKKHRSTNQHRTSNYMSKIRLYFEGGMLLNILSPLMWLYIIHFFLFFSNKTLIYTRVLAYQVLLKQKVFKHQT